MAKVEVTGPNYVVRPLAHQVCTNRETMSPLARGVSKTVGSSPAHTRFQMVKQLGPPLEMFEASQVRRGDPIASPTRLGTLVKKPIPGTRGLGDSNGTKRRGGIA